MNKRIADLSVPQLRKLFLALGKNCQGMSKRQMQTTLCALIGGERDE